MLLQEILDDVDTYVPNSIPAIRKIKWINEIQNQLYRDYVLPDAIFPFTTVTNMQLYTLPIDCAEDRIDSVVIDNNEERYISSPHRHTLIIDAYYWTIQTGVLFINPIRTAGLQGYVYYKPSPSVLSESNLQESPTFPKDYHEILVFGCALKVLLTTSSPDSQKYSYLDERYKVITEKADRKLGKKRNKSVTNVRSWR